MCHNIQDEFIAVIVSYVGWETWEFERGESPKQANLLEFSMCQSTLSKRTAGGTGITVRGHRGTVRRSPQTGHKHK